MNALICYSVRWLLSHLVTQLLRHLIQWLRDTILIYSPSRLAADLLNPILSGRRVSQRGTKTYRDNPGLELEFRTNYSRLPVHLTQGQWLYQLRSSGPHSHQRQVTAQPAVSPSTRSAISFNCFSLSLVAPSVDACAAPWHAAVLLHPYQHIAFSPS